MSQSTRGTRSLAETNWQSFISRGALQTLKQTESPSELLTVVARVRNSNGAFQPRGRAAEELLPVLLPGARAAVAGTAGSSFSELFSQARTHSCNHREGGDRNLGVLAKTPPCISRRGIGDANSWKARRGQQLKINGVEPE